MSNTTNHTPDNKAVSIVALAGHSISHVWDDDGPWPGSGYRHEFITHDVLRWTGIAGDREGQTDHERYDALIITPTVIQIVFVERQKLLRKTLTYDLERRRAFGVLLPDESTIFTLTGRITDTTLRLSGT